jgi:hypothetical protein
MSSSIVIIILVFAALGLLLGFADSVRPGMSGKILTLTTDKMEYAQHDQITFTATNHGSVRLLFSYASLQLHLTNLDTDERHNVISGQVFNYLEPGESKTLVWNQRDGDLEPGNYVARISTAAAGGSVIRTEVNFVIF